MFLDPAKIPAEGLELDQRLRLVDPGTGEADPLVPEPVHLLGQARKGRGGIELEARLTATLCQECNRCLEPFETPFDTEFFLVVVAQAVEFGVREAPLDLDDTLLFYADGGKADLREVAREQIHLNLPLKAVCRDDCAGLCPTCGANRNRIECPCRSEDLDPRLAPLLDLLKPRDEE